MERPTESRASPTNISSQDIHDALDSFGRQSKSSPNDEAPSSKAPSNRDSGVSESSFVSDRLSFASDQLVIPSDSHAYQMPVTSDKVAVLTDPLGVELLSETTDSASNTGLIVHHPHADSSVTVNSSSQWSERQNLEHEWKKLFTSPSYLHDLKSHSLGGKLRFSKFRSIAWKLFLECLPEEKADWITATKQHRTEYSAFKQKCLIDPNKTKEEGNLSIFNPLSQDEDSPWRQYFKDNELKATITQDLDRLYPENAYFHTERMKEMMLNILFCHVKKNETLGYKQGMHELLAPIVYVLDSDSKIYRYMEGELFEVGKSIMDPLYIENDAFTLFCQLMDFTDTWFHYQKADSDPKQQFLGAHATPFTEPVAAPSTAIVKKLNRIQDQLLRKHDPELWLHLKELDIAPQVYGLRWIRLLFSREFPFPDVLVLWDAVFAEGTHLDLVDYIYIGMLQSIRTKLMSGNYNTCVSYLMKFPRVHEDIYSYVKRALSLRTNKSKKSRPSSRPTRPPAPAPPASAVQTSEKRVPSGVQAALPKTTSQSDVTDTAQQKQANPRKKVTHSAVRRPQSALASLTKRYTPYNETNTPALPYRPRHDTSGNTVKSSEELVQRGPSSARPFSVPGPESRERSDSNVSVGSSPSRGMKSLGSELKTKLMARSRSKHDVTELEKDHQRLQQQVMKLNANVDSMEGMFLYCGRKMDSYIGLLQEELMKDDKADRDVVYLTLAGLKQVRDLLKGSLAFRGSTLETEAEFIDIDKGIASRLQSSAPNMGPGISDDIPVANSADYDHFEHETAVRDTEYIGGVTYEVADKVSNDGHVSRKEFASKSKDVCDDASKAMEISSEDGSSGIGSENSNKALPLESYLENHLNQSLDTKKTDSIPVVTCAVGPAVKPQGDPSCNELASPEQQFLTTDDFLSPEHFSADIPDAMGVSVSINNIKFLLEHQDSADMSPTGGPLDGFVFVDKDGKAQGSMTISPTHPLDFSESDTDDE